MDAETADLVEEVMRRPRMYCDAETPRELLLFIEGILCGRHPPHGSGVRAEFCAAVVDSEPASDVRLKQVLLDQFGDRPLLEACEAMAHRLRRWRSDRDLEKGRQSGPGGGPDRAVPRR